MWPLEAIFQGHPGPYWKIWNQRFFRKNPQATESLRGPIYEEKVVDFVVELAKVTDKSVTPEELAVEPDAEA